MTGPARPPTLTPRPDTTAGHRRPRDPYADLLRDSRGLRRDQAAAREAWYASLPLDRKEDLLFELEMLLKGLAGFANPRNHPSAPRPAGAPSTAFEARNFQPHLAAARSGALRSVALCTQLLGRRERPLMYRRYLNVAFADEGGAAEATRDAAVSEGPEDALTSLRHALSTSAEVMEGLLRADRISFRLFFATLAGVQREVSRNAYFNPLVALEFRPEFDRVRVPEVLEAIQSVEGEAAHRLVAVAFLACFRLLKLVQVLNATALDPGSARRSYLLLAALRADARALVNLLQRRASGLLAEGLGRDLMLVSSADLRTRFEPLAREAERLTKLRVALHSVGATLRAELRGVFSHRVPACDSGATNAALSAACMEAASGLRDALQASVTRLTWTVRGAADAERIFGDRHPRRVVSERTRQSLWMFTLVTRAFIAKAKGAEVLMDSWSPRGSQGFVGEYLAYFRALGQQLLVETEYPEAKRLTHVLESLAGADFADPSRLKSVAAECEATLAHLQSAFERLGKREELREHPFDKLAAAHSLKTFMER